MAALALTMHAKSGLLKKEGLLCLILPALVLSVSGALLAARLPGDAPPPRLRSLFDRAFGGKTAFGRREGARKR